MIARRFVTLVVVLVVLFFCVCPICLASSCARRLAGGTNPVDLPFPIELDFGADGSWTISPFGSGLTVSSEFLGMVGGMLGQAVPTMTPEQVQQFTKANIQHVVISVDTGAIKIWMNGEMLPSVEISPAVIDLLAKSGINATLVEFTLRLRGEIYIRFPVADGADEVPLPQDLGVEVITSAEPAVNLIELEATVASDGRIVSIAGFSAEEILAFGFEPPMPQSVGEFPLVAPQAMKALRGGASIKLNPAGVNLALSGESLIQVAWDEPSRMVGLRLAEVLMSIDPERGVADRLEEWLAATQIAMAVHVADEQAEGLPVIQLQKPLVVEYVADGTWRVEGIGPEDLGYRSWSIQPGILERLAAANIQHIQAIWTGSGIHSAVNDQPLPVLELGQGWWSMAFRLAGYETIPEDGKIEQILSGFRIPVVVRFPSDGGAKLIGSAESWTYEPMATAPAVTAEVTATLDRNGHFELGGVEVPGLGRIQVPVAVDLAWTPSPVAPSELMVSVGPNGLAVQADEVNYVVHWDAATLAAASTLADAFGWGATMRQVAGVASTVAITATVQIEVPPSAP